LKIPNSPLKIKRKSISRPFHRVEDETQKTLKSNFNPTIVKNYKNYFKYKSNARPKGNNDDTPEIIENLPSKSRNKANANVRIVNPIPEKKDSNLLDKIIGFFRNLRK
jgi:hypothetical protein